MTVLCCLLSDQHVPNLLSVHHFHPDRLVLIESERMRQRNAAQDFLDALKSGGLDYGDRHEVVPHSDVSDFNVIAATLRQAFAKHPTGHWIVNLTGGTKPMSIIAYEFFKAIRARLIYVEAARPNEILDVETGQRETIEHRLSIEEFLLGYGFEHKKRLQKVRNSEKRAKEQFPAAAAIGRTMPSETLLKIGPRRWQEGRNKGLDLRPHELAPPDLVVRQALQQLFRLRSEGTSLTGRIDKYGVQFLTGGWLEVLLWGLLDRHQERLNIWDVRLGIVPGPRGSTAQNDFDVAFMRDYALHYIECKTGGQEHDPDVAALYKIEAVTRQFRALRVRSYLATTSANLLDENGDIKRSVSDRASLYGCRFVTTPHIQKLAESPERYDLLEEVLFSSSRRS